MGRNRETTLAALRVALGAEPPSGNAFAFVVREQHVSAQVKRDEKGDNHLVAVHFVFPVSAHLTGSPIALSRARPFNWLGKRLHLDRVFRSGDSAFDTGCALHTDASDETLAAIFATVAVRSVALRMLEGNVVRSLEVRPSDELVAVVEARKLEDTVAVKAALALAAALKLALEESERARRTEQASASYRDGVTGTATDASSVTRRWMRREAYLLYSHLAIGLASLVLWRCGPAATLTGVQHEVAILLAIFAADLALVVALVRGRFDSFRHVVLLALASFVTVLPFVFFALRVANASFDSAAGRLEVGEVIATRSLWDGRTGYHWEARALGHQSRLRFDDTPDATPVRCVHFLIRPGALGAPWIEAVLP